MNPISDGFFAALRIPLLAGRDFAPSDRWNTAPVAIVSRSFATRYLGGVERAVGKRITIEMAAMDVPMLPRTVVGVAGDIRPHVVNEPSPTMYAPNAQIPYVGYQKLVVRSSLPAAQVAAAVRTAVAAVDGTIPPPTATSLDHEAYYDALDRRLTDIMLAALAAIALCCRRRASTRSSRTGSRGARARSASACRLRCDRRATSRRSCCATRWGSHRPASRSAWDSPAPQPGRSRPSSTLKRRSTASPSSTVLGHRRGRDRDRIVPAREPRGARRSRVALRYE